MASTAAIGEDPEATAICRRAMAHDSSFATALAVVSAGSSGASCRPGFEKQDKSYLPGLSQADSGQIMVHAGAAREGAVEEMPQELRIGLTTQELALVELALVDLSLVEKAPRIGPVEARCLQSALRKIARATRGRDLNGDSAVTLSATGSEPRPVMVDERSLTITIFGECFVCKPTSCRVLSCLVRNHGQWVRADVLARDALGVCFQKGASNLRWHVLQARRALGARSASLHGDNRLGYMFDLSPCSRKHCSLR